MKVLFFILFISFPVYSQTSTLWKRVNEVSEYIADDNFKNYSLWVNDITLVDSLFNKSKQVCGNTRDALFTLIFACLPYNKITFNVPLLRIPILYPIVSAPEQVFKKKNKQLPKYFFYDSQNNFYGDKDKLAHFFGSAFLKYSLIFDYSKVIGYFVEVFEESFEVQNKISYRDLRANNLGILFAELYSEQEIPPSSIFIYYNFNKVNLVL